MYVYVYSHTCICMWLVERYNERFLIEFRCFKIISFNKRLKCIIYILSFTRIYFSLLILLPFILII